MPEVKKRILIITEYYLPGFTGGGALRMVLNIVDRFFDKYDFFVVTRNYPSRTDRAPYTTVLTDAWNQSGNAHVFYCSKNKVSRKAFSKLISEVKPNLILLNSPFSVPTILFLLLRRRKQFSNIPTIVAACGTLSSGALSLKPLKKRFFLSIARLTGFYEGVIWKASFDAEVSDVKSIIGPDADVVTAPDLMPPVVSAEQVEPTKKCPGAVRFVYFSRIDRKKNLRFLLERLMEQNEGKISLEIIGPVDDTAYWHECSETIGNLPENISVNISGPLPQREALRRLAENHFFVLPTLSENFGYVFLESLAVGCPNLTSDNTVWTDLEARNAGWRIPLTDKEGWIEKIRYCVKMGEHEYNAMSAAARSFVTEWLERSDTEQATERLLSEAISRAPGRAAAKAQ